MIRDWKEAWVDEMGLIVALSGTQRFERVDRFNVKMKLLSTEQREELKECLRQRFTPTNGKDGCQEATESVQLVIK